MLKLLSRFSPKQKLLLGFFVSAAIAGTAFAFFVDHTALIIGLFWLIALLAFVMIMLVRRLNAKITRVLRGAGNAPVKKKGNTTPSRLSSEEPLAVLERKYRKDKSAAAALPLAKRLLQQTGNIAKAQQIVNEIPSTDNLHDDETAFILRVQSLNKYLHEDFVLPH